MQASISEESMMLGAVASNGSMEEGKMINLNIVMNYTEEELKEPASPYATRIPKFDKVYFPEQGTRLLYEFDVLSQRIDRWEVETPWAFPSCFAFVQTPANRIFVTGGIGDDETTKRTIEIVPAAEGNETQSPYGFALKESMNYKRVDHSMCYLTDQFLFVTGSYIQDEKMNETCERYDVAKDRWAKFPPLTVGRAFHASCGFEGRYVFVLCGLAVVRSQFEVTSEEDRGMTAIKEEFHWRISNTIERLDAF